MAQDVFEASEPVDQPVVSTSRPVVAVRKQGITIYTVMLLISLFCLLAGTLLMSIELLNYESIPPWKTGDATPSEITR